MTPQKLPYDPAILLLGLHPKELKVGTQTDTHICIFIVSLLTSLVAQRVKSLPAMQETWVRSLGQEDPLGKKWQPPPVLLPGNSHEQRLLDYSPWDHKESDTTERLYPLTKDRKSRCRLLFPTLSITDLPG